jgi:hypothetical protein
MKHVPYENIKSKVVGAFHDQTAHPGGPESSALVGGTTNPLCAAPTVVNTAEGVSQDVHIDAPLSVNSTRGLELADQAGIRYESDYHRGDPGYTKGFFFDKATPKPTSEPTPAGASGSKSYGGFEHAPFHLEDMKCPQFGTCEQYKTAKVLNVGTEHAILPDYIVGPESEGCHVVTHVFGAAALFTLTTPMVNSDNDAMAYLRVSTRTTSALGIRQVTAPREAIWVNELDNFEYAGFIPARRVVYNLKKKSRASPKPAIGLLISAVLLAPQKVLAEVEPGTTGPRCTTMPGRYGADMSLFTPLKAYSFAMASAVSVVGYFGCSV